MAIKYFQNKRGQDVIVPTAEGSTVVVKPNHFVIDNTGTYYSAISELSEVAQGTVVQANLVYTYDPFYYARVFNTTSKLDPAVENDANAPVTTVPGSNTQVIFNDSNAFGADSGMTYDKATDALTLVGPLTAGNFFEGLTNKHIAIGTGAGVREEVAPVPPYPQADPFATNNIAIGYNSLVSASTGYDNIGIGIGSLTRLNTGDQNVAIGTDALAWAQSSSSANIAIGYQAAYTTNQGNNVAIGYRALYNNSNGYRSTVIGSSAGYNIKGDYNVALGYQALFGGTTGNTYESIGIGYQALYNSTTGGDNVAIGYQAGLNVTSASKNVLIGYKTGNGVFAGDSNIFLGTEVGNTSANGFNPSNNVALGLYSLYSIRNGDDNVAIGTNSMNSVTDGYQNVAIGQQAGTQITTGSYNITIGDRAEVGSGTLVEAIAIGRNATVTSSRTAVIGDATLTDVYLGSVTGAAKLRALNVFEQTATPYNLAFGSTALRRAATGTYNISAGLSSLTALTTGSSNISIGNNSLQECTTGGDNIAIGPYALNEGTANSCTIAIGTQAGQVADADGSFGSVYVGYKAGQYAANGTNTGNQNIMIGYQAGYTLNINDSVVIGYNAMTSVYNTVSGYNTALGTSAGNAIAESWNGSYNTFLGADTAINKAVGGPTTTNNVTLVGYGASVDYLSSNTVVLGNASVTNVLMGSTSGATVKAGKLTLSTLNTAPTSATAAGTAGEIRFANDGIYICTVTGAEGAATWIKATAATF